MSWTDYRSAPRPGAVLCDEAAVDRVAAVAVRGPNGSFPVIVVRSPAGLRAFVNACPHQYLPLDHRGGNILSADGTRLMCSAHGAQFDAASGQGVAGPGMGCALDPVPIRTEGGQVVIDGQ